MHRLNLIIVLVFQLLYKATWLIEKRVYWGLSISAREFVTIMEGSIATGKQCTEDVAENLYFETQPKTEIKRATGME